MACYHPVQAHYAGLNTNGKKLIKFGLPKHSNQESLVLPCGQCIGCRLERSRQWAVRCVHEASLHKENSFITLTYAPEHLPEDGSLDKRHFTLFMKKLRFKIAPIKVRYFMCGEYGEQLARPHFHICLFGYDFPDKTLWKITNTGERLYSSEALSKIWGKGFVTLGSVTHESAAYVARYVMKKITGKGKNKLNKAGLSHYETIDDNGEIHHLEPEYTNMSRRPGLARGWFEKFGSDVYPSDQVVSKNGISKPPRYYDNLLEHADPLYANPDGSCPPRMQLYIIKERRKKRALEHLKDNTPARLRDREICKQAQINHLKRPLNEA